MNINETKLPCLEATFTHGSHGSHGSPGWVSHPSCLFGNELRCCGAAPWLQLGTWDDIGLPLVSLDFRFPGFHHML